MNTLPASDQNTWRLAIEAALGEARFARRLTRSLQKHQANIDPQRILEVPLFERALRDSLNHPVLLIGYFDGFAARTAARQQARALLPQAGLVTDADALLSLATITTQHTVQSLARLLSRDDLSLASHGPTKPGPLRTAQYCQGHLYGIGQRMAAVFGRTEQWQRMRWESGLATPQL